MSTLNDGFYDDDSYSEKIAPSWKDIIVITFFAGIIMAWQLIRKLFIRAKTKIEFKSVDNEYTDWFENQRP